MRNCLILGSPRGGTSLLAGTLSKAGYFMGDHLWPPNEFNPKGIFEDKVVNWVNEELLQTVVPKAPRRPLRWVYRRHAFRYGQRWLAVVPLEVEIRPLAGVEPLIKELVNRQPFCFKDPRFSYTLPGWRSWLHDTVVLCAFREPARTAHSILNSLNRNPRLSNLSLQFDQALHVWTSMYEHVVQKHRYHGDWVFVHYEQIMDGSIGPRIRSSLGIDPDLEFPDGKLRRSPASGDLPERTRQVYAQLCELAGYDAAVPA